MRPVEGAENGRPAGEEKRHGDDAPVKETLKPMDGALMELGKSRSPTQAKGTAVRNPTSASEGKGSCTPLMRS